jgi:hypothetical protein
MEEDTTTPAPVETGAEIAQPVEAAPAEAVETPTADTEEQTEKAPASVSDEDTELNDWASKKGLELDSDNARKAAKMAREAEKAFHAKSQKASELEKAATVISDEDANATAQATGQDAALLQRLQRVEVKEAVRDFWNAPDHDQAFESKMVEIVQQKPYLAGDLDALYASAVYQSGGVAAVKSQGKREALSDLAHKQQAAVPTGNATQRGTPKEKPFAELSIKEMEARLGIARR